MGPPSEEMVLVCKEWLPGMDLKQCFVTDNAARASENLTVLQQKEPLRTSHSTASLHKTSLAYHVPGPAVSAGSAATSKAPALMEPTF